MIIILDGKEYAVGLNWFAITSTDEVQQFQKEMELTHGLLKLNKNPELPSTVALAGSEYEGQVSLAGILSYAYSNLIYVAKTNAKSEAGEDLYYLCTVKNGAVSVEGDIIVNFETVVAIYAANLAEMSAEIPLEDIQRLGTDVNLGDFDGVTLLDFHAVLESAQRYSSQCTIKVLEKAGLSKTAVGLIVVLFVLGGYLGYSWLFKAPPPPPPVAVVTPEVKPEPTPIIQRRDPYEVFLEQFVYNLTQTPEPEVASQLIPIVKQLQMSYSGWTLDSITFLGNAPQSLGLSFTRQPYSSVNGLLSFREMGYFIDVVVTQDGNQATAMYPIVLENIPYINIEAIKNLRPSVQDQYFDMVTAIQTYDLKFQPGQEVTEEGNDYFVETPFGMSGNGLWSLQRVTTILSAFDTLGIISITIVVNGGNYDWTIQGVIYG